MKSFTFPEISSGGKEIVRYFSIMNPWIDVVIIVDPCNKQEVESLVRQAMDEYWSTDDLCYGDLIEIYLKDIPHESVYHDANETSEKYEDAWDDYLDSLYASKATT